MFDDFDAYFYENTILSFFEYLDIRKSNAFGQSRDIRAALVAASALYHLREHLPSEHKISRQEMECLCVEFGVLGDIVNASKHGVLTGGTPHGNPLVIDAASLSEEIISTEYLDSEGVYRYVEKDVVATLADGSRVSILDALAKVMNFWQRHLHALGLTSKRDDYVRNHAEPRAREECDQKVMDLLITQGLRFRMRIKLQRFNYDTCAIEPVDLTGMKAVFRIYRPKTCLDITIRNEAKGVELKRTVDFSEEESEALSVLATEQEKQAYASSLPSVKLALQELTDEVVALEAASKD